MRTRTCQLDGETVDKSKCIGPETQVSKNIPSLFTVIPKPNLNGTSYYRRRGVDMSHVQHNQQQQQLQLQQQQSNQGPDSQENKM